MSPRLPGKYARDFDKLLRSLGYELLRSEGGHLVYGHEDFDKPFVLPSTPSDVRAFANDLARLKRRHPEFFRVTKAPASARRRRKSRNRARQPTMPRFEGTPSAVRATPLNSMPMRCESCARPFQPMAVVAERPCPACDGVLVTEELRESAA